MKTFWCSLAVLCTGVSAQDMNSLPTCERTCLDNLLREAPNYGCPAVDNGNPAPDCLCSKIEFAYGVRDCSTESCPSGTDVNQVNQYGLQYCQSAQASASGTALAALNIFSSGAAAATSSSEGGSSSASSASSSSQEPITTVPVISTITTDSSTEETTLGSSTIYANATSSSGNETAVTTRPVVSTVSESSTTRETTVGSTTEFSSTASSSSSAGAAATMAAPRLVPGFVRQPVPGDPAGWVVQALAWTGFGLVAVQFAWAYGGW